MEELVELIKCEYCNESLTPRNIFGVNPTCDDTMFICPKCKKISHKDYKDFLINAESDGEFTITDITNLNEDEIVKKTEKTIAEPIKEEAPKKRTRKSTKAVAEVVAEAVPKKRTRKSTKAVAEVIPEAVPKKRTKKSTK